jgi:hypothetical protein
LAIKVREEYKDDAIEYPQAWDGHNAEHHFLCQHDIVLRFDRIATLMGELRKKKRYIHIKFHTHTVDLHFAFSQSFRASTFRVDIGHDPHRKIQEEVWKSSKGQNDQQMEDFVNNSNIGRNFFSRIMLVSI